VHSTGYIIKFTVILTLISGLILSGMFYATEPAARKNEQVFAKRGILTAIEPYLDKPLSQFSDDEVLDLFHTQMDQFVVNTKGEVLKDLKADDISIEAEFKKPAEARRLPVYVYKSKEGPITILSVYGNGLWDKIWGYIALKPDYNTIAGAAFDHKGETPGLGAEIKDNPAFRKRFIGKKIFDDAGRLVSVHVKKKVTDPAHEVDGITGATLTSDGVSDMLVHGIGLYEAFLKNKLPKS